MTVKSGIYLYFLCQQGGGDFPPVLLRGGGGSRPPPPLAETLPWGGVISIVEVFGTSPTCKTCHHAEFLILIAFLIVLYPLLKVIAIKVVLYPLSKLIAFYLVFYLLLALIAFYVVFYQATVVVNCILDLVSSLGGVSCRLILLIVFHLCLQLNTQEKFEIYIWATCIYPHTHRSHCNHDPCD